jgi:hypothetical protein
LLRTAKAQPTSEWRMLSSVVVKKIREGGQLAFELRAATRFGSEEQANIGSVFKRSPLLVFTALVPLRCHYAPKS